MSHGASTVGKSASVVLLSAFGAGLVDGIVTYPVESMKIRLQIARKAAQANQAGAAAAAARRISLYSVCKEVVKNEGPLGFYRGIGFHLIGETMKSCWRFFLFESVKKQYIKLCVKDKTKELGVKDNIIVSTMSAIGETILCVQPWERLKIMSLGGASSLQVVRNVVKKEGLLGLTRSLYKGLDMTLVRQWGNSVFSFTVFYWLKNLVLARNAPRKTLTSTEKFMYCYGGLSGASGAFFTMPFDTIKSIKQKVPFGSSIPFLLVQEIKTKGASTTSLLVDLYKREGLMAFYRGTMPRGVAFYSYETIQEAIEWIVTKGGSTKAAAVKPAVPAPKK